jgi:hypothetical protein
MERTTYPFPLAADSSHHSHYHRFMLGVEASVLAPFPKPYCVGALSRELPGLAEGLDLARWRKLYHASIPWRPGFGASHYAVGNVPPHCALPPEYGRPVRRFAAFDFVQIADPSVSALALVAGDRRVLERFVALADGFCSGVERGVRARDAGPSGSRSTGRMLAGQFAEPNNRWLMPFLHVHSRVLNFTSFGEAPGFLCCVDAASLARAGQGEMRRWAGRQAEFLSDLGYRAEVRGDRFPVLRVAGVAEKLLASMEAPRIAVLNILERLILGGGLPEHRGLVAQLPAAAIASMAEQLEALVASSLAYHRPAKVGIPSEGPWRGAVREHLGRQCPDALLALDAAAARARAALFDESLVPAPPVDAAHWHAPRAEALEARQQLPCDPELATTPVAAAPDPRAMGWLAREFEATIAEVNERICRAGPHDPVLSLRSILPELDQSCAGAEPGQVRESRALIGVELDLIARREPAAMRLERAPGILPRFPLPSLGDIFERAIVPRMACEQEIGGRSR